MLDPVTSITSITSITGGVCAGMLDVVAGVEPNWRSSAVMLRGTRPLSREKRKPADGSVSAPPFVEEKGSPSRCGMAAVSHSAGGEPKSGAPTVARPSPSRVSSGVAAPHLRGSSQAHALLRPAPPLPRLLVVSGGFVGFLSRKSWSDPCHPFHPRHPSSANLRG